MKRALKRLLPCFPAGRMELAIADAQGDIKRGRLYDPGDYRELASHAASENGRGHNVYLGAAARRHDAKSRARAGKSNILECGSLWLDLDKEGAYAAARKRWRANDLRPQLVTITGRHPFVRAQAWFFLDAPSADLERVERLNTALARMFDGDDVQNCDRVLRLPGSVAWPVPSKSNRIPELTEML